VVEVASLLDAMARMRDMGHGILLARVHPRHNRPQGDEEILAAPWCTPPGAHPARYPWPLLRTAAVGGFVGRLTIGYCDTAICLYRVDQAGQPVVL
jgi:hypothetical protein